MSTTPHGNVLHAMVEKWRQVRHEIRTLEHKLTKYQKRIQELMDQQGLETFTDDHVHVKKISTDRMTVLKKNVPPEIWSQYATSQKVEFYRFSLVNPKKSAMDDGQIKK